jgi:hypothetical protein
LRKWCTKRKNGERDAVAKSGANAEGGRGTCNASMITGASRRHPERQTAEENCTASTVEQWTIGYTSALTCQTNSSNHSCT